MSVYLNTNIYGRPFDDISQYRILREGIASIKTIKFLQLAGVARGDTLKEIEEKTEKMSKEEGLRLIQKTKAERRDFWKKTGAK